MCYYDSVEIATRNPKWTCQRKKVVMAFFIILDLLRPSGAFLLPKRSDCYDHSM